MDANSDQATRDDATFTVRAGLAGSSGVSLEAVNLPGSFLVVDGTDVKLRKNDGTAGFAGNATYLPVHGLTGQNTSLALWSDPTRYLRHNNFVLQATVFDGSDTGRHDATFAVRPPVQQAAATTTVPQVGQRIALQPVNAPTYRVRHQDFALKLSVISGSSPQLDRDDSTFQVDAGLSDAAGISLEAVNYPGYYVEAVDGVVYLRKNDGTAAFAAKATFLAQQGLAGTGGISLALDSAPTTYLRHRNYVLYAEPSDGSDLTRNDSTFTVLTGG